MPIDQRQAPLYEALAAHAGLRAHSFHVPGHKQQEESYDPGSAAFYRALLPLDVTELADTDDLHHPQGPLAEAQRLAAQCFGAEETSFLVGGSTSGNMAMILGTGSPGDLYIVQRNVHKSIVHGLMLAGARAVMLAPQLDSLSGLAVIPPESSIETALQRYPEARGLILSTPNYYGMVSSLDRIVRLAHERGVPVLIDEAHGAHFGFHPAFPESALRAGADVVVQSTHKMLSAMTMGAMLHMQGDIVDREAIKQALRMVQSSSPSFPILASLDLARRQLHTSGAAAFEPALEAVHVVADRLEETPFRAVGNGGFASDSLRYDPLKLVLFDQDGKLSGSELQGELAKRNCMAEMADDRYTVLAFGPGNRKTDGEALLEALRDISNRIRDLKPMPTRQTSGETGETQPASGVPQPVTFRRGRLSAKSVRLEASEGLIAGEWVIPYPPGIPVLYPGETITKNTIIELLRWRSSGAQIQGALDAALEHIVVQGE
ncbi:aminotransferase class I/II-fold pyridoxal phosphate-dependent enzyme [Cohnella panacarvi]|uniref:aminotransferase class I/II-fold pyridoxal phosphate-dependent enzyme n=1 Tax=Cohnella panacarvi TaxID=400776 RepID=UPI00047E1F69|nr:aminotransferase class I/II-fold pyridoxal phosphate-dependent enzyme [Cohnella panacarvi]